MLGRNVLGEREMVEVIWRMRLRELDGSEKSRLLLPIKGKASTFLVSIGL